MRLPTWTVALLFCGLAAQAQAFSSPQPGQVIEVALEQLHPTQAVVGFDQIYYSLGLLHRFDVATRRFTTTRFAVGDPNSDTIRNVAGERSGMLWVSTRGGVHHFDPASGKFTTFRHDPADPASLSDNMVRPVLEDRQGRVWIGTFHGLDLYDRATGKFRHYRHEPHDASSLSHDEVHYLHEDKRGVLWVGTANGLNRMDADAQGNIRFRR